MSPAAACIANIGPREQQKRLRGGALAFLVGLLLAGLLAVTGISRSARLVLAIPFWGAALGYFQARGKT